MKNKTCYFINLNFKNPEETQIIHLGPFFTLRDTYQKLYDHVTEYLRIGEQPLMSGEQGINWCDINIVRGIQDDEGINYIQTPINDKIFYCRLDSTSIHRAQWINMEQVFHYPFASIYTNKDLSAAKFIEYLKNKELQQHHRKSLNNFIKHFSMTMAEAEEILYQIQMKLKSLG